MDNVITLLWVYFAIVNLLLYALMGIDKYFAIARKRRIPETALFLLALFGGSIGGLFGMYCFRHKTKHKEFTIGFTLILIVEIGLVMLAIRMLSI